MKNRRTIPLILYLALLVLIFTWAGGLFDQSQDQIPYSEVLKLFRQEQVKSFIIDEDDHVISLTLNTPYDGQTIVAATLADPDRFLSEVDELITEQTASGVLEYYHLRTKRMLPPMIWCCR